MNKKALEYLNHLDDQKLNRKKGIITEGQITKEQVKELIDYADHLIWELELSPIGYSLGELPKTPTKKIIEIMLMSELEWYNEGRGYLSEIGAIYYSNKLKELKEETN